MKKITLPRVETPELLELEEAYKKGSRLLEYYKKVLRDRIEAMKEKATLKSKETLLKKIIGERFEGYQQACDDFLKELK